MLIPERDPGRDPGSRAAATIHAQGCAIVVRRFEGPVARELFLHVHPPADVGDSGRQAAAMYHAILDVLDAQGGDFRSVVAETLFLRELPANLASVRDARRGVLARRAADDHRPATTEIEQPPLDGHACLEISVQAIVPRGSPLRSSSIGAGPGCRCTECASAHGLRVELGDEIRFQAAGLCGPGSDAYAQTLGMFAHAEQLLQRAGFAFGDVVRTWIHLRHMDRDYAALNRARRAFFAERGLEPVPASTGIGGGPPGAAHDLCLGVQAVKAPRPVVRTVMTSPTLNEAREYGADFVRGLKVQEANRIALHVSGTASIDELGRTAHGGDVDAQADRMLLNIAALLEGQGARYADVVQAVTYLKHPADAARVRERLRRAGFAGFPHAIVAAPICRPDLLCETEALAVLVAAR